MAEKIALKTMDEIEAITSTKPVPVGAADAFTSLLPEATAAQEYTGNVPQVEKEKLCGVPMLILGFSTITAEHGAIGGADASYIWARVMLPNGEQVGFVDGGSMIPPVLEAHANAKGAEMDEDGREATFTSPLFCKRGLLKSDYTNEYGPATTYHLT